MKNIIKKNFYSMLGFIFIIQAGIARAIDFWNDVQISQVWIKGESESMSPRFLLYASMATISVSMIIVPLGLLIGLIVIIVAWKDKEKRKLGLKILLWSVFIPILMFLIIWIINSLSMFFDSDYR